MDNNKSKHRKINIDLFVLGKMLWDDKKRVCKYCFIAAIAGVIVAFSIPRIYKSTAVLAPEEAQSGLGGGLSSIASMVGLDMKIGTSDAIYPEIYPDIINSTNFIVGLFPMNVKSKDGKINTTLYDYTLNHQKSAWWNYPRILLVRCIEKLKSNDANNGGEGYDPFHLTKQQEDVYKSLVSNIKCNVDKKTNVISIQITAQDPYIAKNIADSVKSRLQIYITDYRTKKTRNDVNYLEKIYNEADENYKKASARYSSFVDSHQNTVLERYKAKEEDLRNDMQLKYGILEQITEQLQLARAKVQERTPAFSTIQNATVPTKHANKPKILILGIFVIIGFMARTMIIIWNNKDKFITE